MGIYQADMVFPVSVEFPFILPKFGILIKYYEIKDKFFDDVMIRVFFPGDAKDAPSITIPFQRENFNTAISPFPLEEDQERVFNITFPLVLPAAPIKQEGYVKVRASCGGIVTNLGSLMVRKIQPNENIQIPIFPPPLPPQPPS
jgi:hypothetical protein